MLEPSYCLNMVTSKCFSIQNKEFDGISENISFVEMELSKLINYSTNMCQVTKVLLYTFFKE